MASSSYNVALSAVLREEGGKVDNPKDPGGRTNQGITQAVYDGYRQRKGLPTRDVYIMDSAERDTIYRQSYWNLVHGDALPPGVDLAVFDGAVNSGPARSAKWLQQALGVTADGLIGPATEHAALIADPEKVIADYMAARRSFLRTLKTFKTFGRGWLARCDRIETQAASMARGGVGVIAAPVMPQPTPQDGTKAREADVKAAPPKGLADVATGVGIGAGGLSQVINGAKDQLEPYSYASAWVSKLVIALIVLGFGLALLGLAWRGYAMWRESKRVQ